MILTVKNMFFKLRSISIERLKVLIYMLIYIYIYKSRNNANTFSIMSNLPTNYSFKLGFQTVDQHARCKWLFFGTKHRSDNQLQGLQIMCTFLLQNGALWDSGLNRLMHCGVCEIYLLQLYWRLCFVWWKNLTNIKMYCAQLHTVVCR